MNIGINLMLSEEINGNGEPVPPGFFTYRRPGGLFFYIRPTSAADTYLRP